MISRTSLLVVAAVLSAAPVAVAQQQDGDLAKIKEQELQEVREQIGRLKEAMDKRAAERDRVTAELQAADVEIAEKRVNLDDVERRLQGSEKRTAELEASIAEREQALAVESRQLESQVRAAYMNGGQERLKLLLNQQEPATLGRQLQYYQYLSAYRAENIESVNAKLVELSGLRTEVAREADSLASLRQSRQAELDGLGAAQSRRRTLLANLDARIAAEGTEIEHLAAQEQDLARLIAELTSILSDYPITSEDPFVALKGKLTWPVAGRVIHDYGQPRATGQLKWNGVVVAAPRGREVRSVYHGRVVFADWLAGMGLLVIVDHGEGYLTLYGYNETLLKSAGDWVAPGDVIATVGDSGGQPQAGLYFEIRQGAKPVDPRSWVSRKPKTG